MPIKIPDNLPARKTLEDEGVLIIREHDARRQDIRPISLALLNLMPEKIKTETQLARLIGSTPLQVELTLLTTESYTPRNTPQDHMLAFYQPWSQVADQKFDGLIVTGAPVEEIPFEDVRYWDELAEILDWARTHVFRSYNICWGAQAALYHYYGVPKHALPQKLSGIYRQRVKEPKSPLMRGFNAEFNVPVSRYTGTLRADVEKVPELRVLAESETSGLCIVEDTALGQVHVFNHFEYDTGTLADEYGRDVDAGRDIKVPQHYYPDEDPTKPPVNTWRCHGHLLFGNWINAMYQETPFDIAQIGADREPAETAA
ncbi:MAG: homoserine O-succinyltransferase [Rhodospirillaceae bacterium]|jgi:homoserine O-succinyltransferase/O-acetyltransferase|nr:homoserine O-succinyltransferase [Rhodospirillaceae bacterium]MBT6118388.1 homoserine O-succinyltransferase [Rhodospirillaceae bacterium]